MNKTQAIGIVLQDLCEAQREASRLWAKVNREWVDDGMLEETKPDFEAYWQKCVRLQGNALKAIMEVVG